MAPSSKAIPKEEKPEQQRCQNIIVPEFKVLNNDYYLLTELDDKINMEQEENYAEVHKLYEMSEMCGHFLNVGQGLPEALKDGLKVKLHFPVNP